MKKIIITILFLCLNSYAATSLSKINFDDFSSILADEYKINIVYDSDVDLLSSFYLRNDVNKISAFEIALKEKGYQLKKFNNIFYVSKKNDIKIYNVFKVSYLNKKMLEVLKEDFNFHHFPSKNILIFNDIESKFLTFSKIINALQKKDKQLKFKITIFNTNLDKLDKRGLNLSMQKDISKSNFNLFVDFVKFPFNTATSTIVPNNFNIYSVIDSLKKDGTVSIINEPFMLAKHLKKSSFEVVKNIPYQVSSIESSNDSSSTKTTNSIEYKDVGLKFDILPTINKDNIELELSLTIENIVSMNDNAPITDKKHLNSFFDIKKNQKVLISGLTNTETTNTLYTVPIIENIPFLNDILKHETKQQQIYNLSILIESL